MTKLVLILFLGGALLNSLTSSQKEPPLLIDASNSNAPALTTAPLDAGN